MLFLAPIGGFVDQEFGILTSPSMRGIPAGIKAGMKWGADNNAFTKGFDPDKFFPWLEMLRPYQSTCLFVCCPDVVGSAKETLSLFETYRPKFSGWPVAFVAQDGQENLEFPEVYLWSCLFVGGSIEWKLGDGAKKCIDKARILNKHIHIGRVNRFKRYRHFADLDESCKFTCDGTRVRYERDKTIIDWKEYMKYIPMKGMQ